MGFDIFSMPSATILLLFSACSLSLTPVQALPWSGPQPTAVYKADEWSPRPTSTSDPNDLFKRDSVGVNVCGWYAGLQASPAACDAGSSCIHDTVQGNIGCCTTDGPCTAGVYTSCVDQNSAGWQLNSGVQVNGVYTCGVGSVCNRLQYPNGYYQYACGASSSAATVATTFAGQPTDLLLQIVFTAVDYTTPIRQSAPTTPTRLVSSTSAPIPTTTAENMSQSSASITPTATMVANTGSKSNTAVIAAGAVGGVAGLAALAGIVLCCLRRRQKGRYNSYKATKVMSHDNLSSSSFQRVPHFPPEDFDPYKGIGPGGIAEFPTEPPRAASIREQRSMENIPRPISIRQQRSMENIPSSAPSYRTEVRSVEEIEPFVNEIDHFSRSWTAIFNHEEGRESVSSWHEALFGDNGRHPASVDERDTHIHTGPLPPVSRNSSRSERFNFGGSRNTRIADLDASRESIRSLDTESVILSPQSHIAHTPLYSVNLEDDNEEFLNRALTNRGRVPSSNIRMEGWSPSRLRIPPRSEQATGQDRRRRYSLSDPGSDGRELPVIADRPTRHQRDRASIGSSRGTFSNRSISIWSQEE
ncbi:hypothetical protein B7463_g8093, partial [Scytalidium lignicola]